MNLHPQECLINVLPISLGGHCIWGNSLGSVVSNYIFIINILCLLNYCSGDSLSIQTSQAKTLHFSCFSKNQLLFCLALAKHNVRRALIGVVERPLVFTLYF